MNRTRYFFSRWQNILALFIVLIFIGMATLAPVLAPPLEGEIGSTFRKVDDLKGQLPFPPSNQAILGTVPTGIRGTQLDVYYTLVWGSRSALKFGLLAALGAALLGIFLGATGAYIGGWGESLIMRFTDSLLAIPIIVGVVVLQNIMDMALISDLQLFRLVPTIVDVNPSFSPFQMILQRVDPVLMAIVLFSWMPYTRLTHAMVKRISKAEYIEAARALGASSGRIIFKHLIPNSISPAIVLGARDIGGMVLLQATFTFIGMGGDSEWGLLLATGRRWVIGAGGNLSIFWWVFVPITLALILFGIGWNLLGDGVNDLLDPYHS